MKKAIVIMLCTILALYLSVTAFAEPGIAFKDPAYILNVGNKLKLDVKMEELSKKDLNIEYSSSDENVVSINKGQAVGVSEGKANITCTATDKANNTYTAKCTVSVIVPIKRITVDKNSIILASDWDRTESYSGSENRNLNGDMIEYYKFTPKIKIEPENATIKDLNWESENENIAWVSDEGVIGSRGFFYGDTTIVGRSKDGSNKSVKIKVGVYRAFTTKDEIIIDSPEGDTLEYVHKTGDGIESRNGITKYVSSRMYFKGDCFTTEDMGYIDGFKILKILPKKAGNGSIIFVNNGKISKKVKIKVLKSAFEKKEGVIRTEFKKSMDEYKEFMDKYVEFMNDYNKNSSSLAMLNDYASMLQEYEKMVKGFEAWDQSELSKAELEYYFDTQSYVNKKLLEISL